MCFIDSSNEELLTIDGCMPISNKCGFFLRARRWHVSVRLKNPVKIGCYGLDSKGSAHEEMEMKKANTYSRRRDNNPPAYQLVGLAVDVSPPSTAFNPSL